MKKYAMGGMTTTSETTKKPVSSKRVEFKKTEFDKKIEKTNKGNASGVRAKSGTTMKKAKSGAKFDLNKDGKTTFKDVLIGRGVLPKTAKSGAKMKMGGKMAKQAAVAIAMKKAGKKPKKAQTGTAQKQMDSNVSQLAMKNAAGSLMTAGKAKSGKSMKKCKYGCK